MKANAYKLFENQSRAIANNTVQKKKADTAISLGKPIQMYKPTMDGLESNGGKMEVKHNGDLWATSAGLMEANSKGTFLFVGEGTEHKRAPVMVKPGNVGIGGGNKQVGGKESEVDMAKWRETALSEVRGRVNEYAEQQMGYLTDEEDTDKMDFIKEELEKQGIKKEDIGKEIQRRYEIWKEGLLQNALIQIDEYARDFRHYDLSRVSLTTDCQIFSSVVNGYDPEPKDIGVKVQRLPGGAGDETIVEWPYHYAAPIMTDSGDYVTMETAAAKVTDFFSKPDKDRAWGFKMYGAQKGETFKDKFGPLLSGGKEFVPGEGFVESEY